MNAFAHIPRKLLALVAVVLLVPSGGALASQVFADSAGDAPGGAPDITQATVSHKLAGDVTFSVAFANRATLSGEDFVVLSLDSDQNRSTGEQGEDYWLGVSGDSPTMAELYADIRLIILPQGTIDWMYLPLGTVPVSWSNQTMTVTFNKGQVDATKGLDFMLLSHTGGNMSLANTEFVPHNGMSSYALDVSIGEIQLPTVVTKVKAGKVFSVRGATVKLSTDEVFTPESLTAKAKIAGKTLKPLAGGLSWKVPKAAKGKKLVVTLAASYQGMQSTQTFTIKVVK